MTMPRARAAALGLGLALTVLPGLAAAEGGAIRGGEHAGFTRLALQVDPMTEWSLETLDAVATIRFPGKPIAFSTAGVFDRIPQTRVRAVTATTGASETLIEIKLGCDCRVSASFVGARYLAIDVGDRDAAQARVVAVPQGPAPESPETRAAREAAAVATAEGLLLQQIERAAGQGLVQLSLHPAPPAATAEVREAPAPAVEAAPAPRPAEPRPRPLRPVMSSLAGLADEDQIEATTVYDRDDAREIARRARARVPVVCLQDAAFDFADWSTGRFWVAELAALRGRLVGEFDRPDPAALRALARFYLRSGFGAEARALLAGFPEVEDFEDRALLVDLARVVDGETAAAGGPLALDDRCPGRHALWLALGGVAAPFRDAASFTAVEAAFAELPPELRALLGPRLVGRLLDAARPGEARRILDMSARSGDPATRAVQLAEARTRAAEGQTEEAVAALAALGGGGDPVAREALERATRIALDAGLQVPETLVVDLRTAARQYRGSGHEAGLRALLVEVLAARAELLAALDEVRAARDDLPAERARFERIAVRQLATADPDAVRPSVYAGAVLDATDLIAAAPADDPDRRVIAERLVDLGLPSPALRVVGPAVAAGDRAARLVGARAELRLGRTAAARATLAGLNGPGSVAVRAEAFVLEGAYGRALALLERRDPAAAGAIAWPAGAWTRLPEESGEARRAMAAYMAGGTAAPAPDPAALAADAAFLEPLPDLSRPSLAAARRLLATGPKVGDLVAGALAEGQ